ncbi:MAG: cutinase family protein [Candidatus Saccharibacteria bacterium]|nr:cutinase family protein [Candidatus Saccharibacteria bacterium]
MAILTWLSFIRFPVPTVSAVENCPEVKIVFARGSGGERWNDQNYLAFKNGVEKKLQTTGLGYEFLDLDYPAVGVGNFWTLLGAFFGAGEAYEFGDSVNMGVSELVRVVNNECPNTKYILGGYSQGAMVVSKSLRYLNADKVIYAATFGDPKIFLPEGFGAYPDACRNVNLSEYREYVPDCYAYMGMLGTYAPYQPESFSGKYGTWCNSHDIFCSSYVSISSHTSYVAEDRYEDAAEKIFEKVAEEFNIEIKSEPTKDLAILIAEDRNYSWGWAATAAKDYAVQLLDGNNRVAIYNYSENALGVHSFRKLCGLGECDSEGKIITSLGSSAGSQLLMNGKGDAVLAALERIIQESSWGDGNEKEVVIFSNYLFGNSSLNGGNVDEVINAGREQGVKLSAKINLSGLTSELQLEMVAKYEGLTKELGGETIVVDEQITPLSLEVDEIADIPLAGNQEKPTLEILNIEEIDTATVRIKVKNSATKLIVSLNDGFLGMTAESEITISGLDRTRENIIQLSPLSETRRGDVQEIKIGPKLSFIPKAPRTGSR